MRKVMADKPMATQPNLTGSAAKWLIVVLLSVIAACLMIEAGVASSSARAQAGDGSYIDDSAGSARGGDIFAVAGRVSPNTYGIYLVDRKNGTIVFYEWLASSRKLHLKAARNYTFDLQLDEYNTEPPPADIKKLVEQHPRLGAGGGR